MLGKDDPRQEAGSRLGVLRLTPDEWHRFLFGQDATHPKHDQRHDKIEALQWSVAASGLALGLDVILDFGFWTKIERQDHRQRAAKLGAETRIHFLDLPIEELLKRLGQRNKRSSNEVTFIPTDMMND